MSKKTKGKRPHGPFTFVSSPPRASVIRWGGHSCPPSLSNHLVHIHIQPRPLQLLGQLNLPSFGRVDWNVIHAVLIMEQPGAAVVQHAHAIRPELAATITHVK